MKSFLDLQTNTEELLRSTGRGVLNLKEIIILYNIPQVITIENKFIRKIGHYIHLYNIIMAALKWIIMTSSSRVIKLYYFILKLLFIYYSASYYYINLIIDSWSCTLSPVIYHYLNSVKSENCTDFQHSYLGGFDPI